jgi:hypothetical protein
MHDQTQASVFIDTTSILTFSGASAGVFAFTATIRRFVPSHLAGHPIWALLMCLVISFGLAQNSSTLGNILGWIIALLNACMLFTSVMGANEFAAAASTEKPAGEARQQGKKEPPKRFFQSYF